MDQEEKIDAILSSVKNMEKDLGNTMRAVYGDKPNKVPGLIDRQLQDEEDIKSLKDGRKKLGWVLAGFITAIQAVWFLIKEILS